jgi:pentatricopeptide repeat protein
LAHARVRIQICGRITVEINGERRETRLPGQQGRLLLAYAVLRRHESITRDEVTLAIWGDQPPRAADGALAALLSKLRRALAPISIRGLRIELPPDGWVDLEGARAAIHRAESALVAADHPRAWAAAQTALFVARRGFLPDEDRPWVEQVGHELDGLRLRALETYAEAALRLGDTELATAERASRELVGLAPYRDSAYRLLMNALAARGNYAEALRTYDQLRHRLRDDLGADPSPDSQDLHASMLAVRSNEPN